jgi:hypothetical protein
VTTIIRKVPTVSAQGYVNISVILSKEGSEEESQTYWSYKWTPLLQQSFAQAKAAVETRTQSISVKNEDGDTETYRQSKQNFIVSKGQEVVNQEQYTVSLKEDLEINESSLTAKGSAAITLTIKDNSGGKEEDVTITWVIPMAAARYICSCGNFTTYNKSEMASHITEKGKLGEIHTYTTTYEYAQE